MDKATLVTCPVLESTMPCLLNASDWHEMWLNVSGRMASLCELKSFLIDQSSDF